MSSTPPTASPAAAGGLLKSSVASASSLMALQLFSRAFTFVLNQALFRLASPSAFGAAAIQFELILSTILFLSREGVRNALLRVPADCNKDRTIRRMNLSFIPILLGIPLSLCTSILYVRFASQEIKGQPYFTPAISLYAVAAMIELLAEPLYNVAMIELKTGVRVRAEGLSITVKSMATFLILFYDSNHGQGDLALLAFAFGQLAFATTLSASYIRYFGLGSMRPKVTSTPVNSLANYVDSEGLTLSLTMTMQSLLKHFLTEGDKIILSWFSPLRDQGGYAIAVNYGSLVARIVFQPIEESLRLFFSRLLGNHDKEEPKHYASLEQASRTLHSLLSVQVAFSIIIVVFGTAYLPVLLPLLLPPQYLATSAPSILKAWVWYIPVLALNGGLEAFLSSVATPQDLNKQSRWMIIFSTTFILSAAMLYKLGFGDASLVYANVINLSFHSSPELHFNWYSVLPPVSLWTAVIISAALIYGNEQRLTINAIASKLGRSALTETFILLHVVLGVFLSLICLSIWWTVTGQYLRLPMNHSKAR